MAVLLLSLRRTAVEPKVAMFDILAKFDVWLFYRINGSGRNILFDHFMPFISNEKNFYIPLGLTWLYLIIKKDLRYRLVAVAMLALIGVSEFVCSDVLKPTFERPRPYHAVSHVHLYNRVNKTWEITPKLEKVVRDQSQSMPSAHATNIFAAACFLSYFFRRLWPFFFSIALAVGYSRIYLGVHYPMDVLVGAITGACCALGAIFIANRILARWGGTPKDKQEAQGKPA